MSYPVFISVEEALSLVRQHFPERKAITLPLDLAAGHFLAAPLHATQHFPPFAQSAMDGYAFCIDDLAHTAALKIQGEVAAGDIGTAAGTGVAVRIFTGAALPAGTDTVVEQESVAIEGGHLRIVREAPLTKGQHVRPPGSEITAGTLALPAGALLTPAAVGFLAGIGIAEAPVWAPLRVTLLVTGNELCAPGTPLPAGKVYESNSVALKAALAACGVTEVSVEQVPDDAILLRSALENALDKSDLVLLTGGVSVGDYDLVPEAAVACGVQTIFHKVRQRPGKPLFFGKKGAVPVFGLPGNPASVLTCFYVYVRPLLASATGKSPESHFTTARLRHAVEKRHRLTQFFKGHYQNGQVEVLPAQESYKMISFAQANCLIIHEANHEHLAAEREVSLILI